MTKKFYVLILLLLIGFLIQPIQAYACGTHSTKTEKTTTKKIENPIISKSEPKTEKSCCTTSKNTFQDNTQKKECCQKYASTQKEKKCDNTCNSNSCQCSTSCQSIGILSLTEIRTIFFIKIPVFDIEKEKINYNENFLSSGFLSLWLPPKIA